MTSKSRTKLPDEGMGECQWARASAREWPRYLQARNQTLRHSPMIREADWKLYTCLQTPACRYVRQHSPMNEGLICVVSAAERQVCWNRLSHW